MNVQMNMFDMLTEEETPLEKCLKHGSGYEGGQVRILAAAESMVKDEFAAWLKEEFGTGGHSEGGMFFDYSPKGCVIRKYKDHFEKHFTWAEVAACYYKMIAKGIFPDQKSQERLRKIRETYVGTPAPRMKFPPDQAREENCRIIPDEIWEKRCRFCTHKNAAENIPVPVSWLGKYQYDRIIPCRIISLFHTEKTGECVNFHPEFFTGGICYSCRHNNRFHEGFCTKEDHAPQRRVYYADGFGGDEKHRDYWGRHVQCVCDDYEPRTEGMPMIE